MTEQQQLSEILSLLNKLDTDIRETNRRVEQTNKRLEEEATTTKEQFEKWDERYFQLVRDQGNTARTIIIAAASVVILSPVLGAVMDLVSKHFLNNG